MFTSAAIDKIDHSPASSTAINAFHGTSTSIFSHPKTMEAQAQLNLENDIEKSSVPLDQKGCKKKCSMRCRCRKFGLEGTELFMRNGQFVEELDS